MDMSGNPVEPVVDQVVGTYISDVTGLQIVEFVELNLVTETATLQFSETLNINSLNFSDLRLQTLFVEPRNTVYLTGGTVPQSNQSLLEVTLSQEVWII